MNTLAERVKEEFTDREMEFLSDLLIEMRESGEQEAENSSFFRERCEICSSVAKKLLDDDLSWGIE